MVDYFLFNEFSNTLTNAGYFNRNFTSADIPSNIPFKLNTNNFENLVPGLYELYPNKELILSLSSNKSLAPNLVFNEETQNIEGNLFKLCNRNNRYYFCFRTC